MEWDAQAAEGKVRCHDVFPRYAGWRSISAYVCVCVCVINGTASLWNAFRFHYTAETYRAEEFQFIQHKV
jgi:hypothetical protein